MSTTTQLNATDSDDRTVFERLADRTDDDSVKRACQFANRAIYESSEANE